MDRFFRYLYLSACASVLVSCAIAPDPRETELPPAQPEPIAAAEPRSVAPAPERAKEMPAVWKPFAGTADTALQALAAIAAASDPAPTGVGAMAVSVPTLAAADKAITAASFRAAYREAALRGVPVVGVLGGDLVHAWLPPARSGGSGALVQNWREEPASNNSWGLPGLVLAVAPMRAAPTGAPIGVAPRVFIVRGAILDAYGQGGGLGGANGIAGYGVPVGDELRTAEGTAQRFEFGTISIKDTDGAAVAAFTPELPQSTQGIPESVGEAGTAPIGARGRTAFRAGWTAAVDSGLTPATPDGPVFRIERASSVLWAQTFGGNSWALTLDEGRDGTVSSAKRITGVFLQTYLFAGSWEHALERFGVPLTDSFVVDGVRRQVFSRGAMEARGEIQ